MPRNGSGTYDLPEPPVVGGTTITTTWANNTTNDIATALTNSIAKDGETVWTGDDDHNGNSIILDADGDTSITADTDDRIDFEIGGADRLQLTAARATALQNVADGDIGTLIMEDDTDSGGVIFAGSLTSAYDRYEIVLKNVILSADGGIVIEMGTSGETYDYAFTENGGAAVTASSAAVIALGSALIGSDTNEDGMSITIIVDDPGGTTKWKRIRWTGAYRNSSGALITTQGVGEMRSTGAAPFVYLFASTSATANSGGPTFESGTIRVYGYI